MFAWNKVTLIHTFYLRTLRWQVKRRVRVFEILKEKIFQVKPYQDIP